MDEPKDARRALELIPYGLYVVGSLNGSRPATMIANWVTQAAFAPPCVAVAIESDSRMSQYIRAAGYFSVNALPAGGRESAKAFLKSPEAEGETIAGKRFDRGRNGTPLLHDAVAAVECAVTHTVALPDHVLFVGEVVDAVVRRETQEILTLRETGWHYQR